MNFIILSLSLLMLGLSCSHESKNETKTISKLKDGERICLANLTVEGEAIIVEKDKKKLTTCIHLKKIIITHCPSNKDMMEVYHLSLLKNQVAIAKGDTLFYRKLIKPNRKGQIVAHAFKCIEEKPDDKSKKKKH